MKYIFVLLVALLLVGCTTSIEQVKNEDNVGKTIVVRGTVEGTIKLGKLSGYTLVDDSGSIKVSSEELPKEGDTITVKGVLMKDTLLGYYVKGD